jgi:hypothetical protein
MIKLPDIEAFKKLRASPGTFSVWVIEYNNPEHCERSGFYSVRRWEVMGSVSAPKDFCGVVETLDVARTYAPRGTRPMSVDWPEQPHVIEVMVPEEPYDKDNHSEPSTTKVG